jgi:ribosomal protein RSM22 (predicted rRNA methylase)
LNYEGKSKEEIIKSEKRKLAGIYLRLDKKTKKSVDSLVEEAAFMAASLYELRKIIDEKGYTEEYQNGANQKGVKKCSEVEIYSTMIKNYSSVVKQLTDLLPKEQTKGIAPVNDGFEEFVNGRDD